MGEERGGDISRMRRRRKKEKENSFTYSDAKLIVKKTRKYYTGTHKHISNFKKIRKGAHLTFTEKTLSLK